MSLFPLSLVVEPCEQVALHLSVAHDKISRQIAICNDNYKFTVFSHNISHGFAVNEVTSMFHHEIVMSLHNHRTSSYKVLKRNASITYERDIP